MNHASTPADFLDKPRQTLQIIIFLVFVCWQTIAAVLGLALFILTVRIMRLNWKVLLPTGVIVGVFSLELQLHACQCITLITTLHDSVWMNVEFWHRLLLHQQGFVFLYHEGLYWLIGIPFILAGILSVIELIPNSAHEEQLRKLQQGTQDQITAISQLKLQQALDQLSDQSGVGTVLGVSVQNGKAVVLPDAAVNQLVLVVGTTGAGKTVTIRRFYQRAIEMGYPLIIVDAKPDEKNIGWVQKLAHQHHKKFYGFNCGNFLAYNCLAEGGYTELKDKLISLKDEWSSDHYRSIAEDYLQAVLEVLLASSESYDLKQVTELLDYHALALLTRKVNDPRLMKRVQWLESYVCDDIKGLRAHLSLLVHSELGQYFENSDHTFSLRQVIDQNAVVYFALPALRFPSFAKVLGKLVINDIKTVIDRGIKNKKLFTVFDEFSVFAGHQVLNVVNMGREKGIHTVFGTQGIAELEEVSPQFARQILNCVNTLICHRVNDQTSAEMIASWAGTHDVFNVTAQITVDRHIGVGSVRRVKEFVVHPDVIKQALQPGEAMYISKVNYFCCDKIKVKYS